MNGDPGCHLCAELLKKKKYINTNPRILFWGITTTRHTTTCLLKNKIKNWQLSHWVLFSCTSCHSVIERSHNVLSHSSGRRDLCLSSSLSDWKKPIQRAGQRFFILSHKDSPRPILQETSTRGTHICCALLPSAKRELPTYLWKPVQDTSQSSIFKKTAFFRGPECLVMYVGARHWESQSSCLFVMRKFVTIKLIHIIL